MNKYIIEFSHVKAVIYSDSEAKMLIERDVLLKLDDYYARKIGGLPCKK